LLTTPSLASTDKPIAVFSASPEMSMYPRRNRFGAARVAEVEQDRIRAGGISIER